MIREIIKPQSQKYILHLPKEYINKKIEILVLPFDFNEEKKDRNSVIDFSKYKVKAFENIKDPVKWQQKIRNEWERECE